MKMIARNIKIGFLALLLAVGIARAEPGNDIYLDGGQSNDVGQGLGAYAYTMGDDARILQLGRYGADNLKLVDVGFNNLQHWNTTTGIGHTIEVARLYTRFILLDDRKLVIIPVGKGNTSIDFWQPGQPGWTDILARVDFAMHLPGVNRFVGMGWQQGETDVHVMNAATYQARLGGLFNPLRARYGNFPIIIGEMPREIFPSADKEEIRTGQIAYVASDIYSAFISSESLKSNVGDTSHFRAASQIKLGERYFDKFFDLYYRTRFNPNAADSESTP